MAMTAQEYLGSFNAAINQGNYEDAARVVKEADLAGYGDEAYRAAAVILDRNPNLPQEIDFTSPQGIQSIRDYVNTATAPAPVASYGPPSPAVSPVVSNSISLTPAGIAALAPSANVSSPANVFSPADYGPPSPPPAAPSRASPAEIQRMQAQRAEAELLRLREAERPIVDPRPQPTVDPVDQQAGGLLNQYYAAIDAGDIRTARNLLSQAQTIYGPETLTNVAQDMLSRLNQTMTQAKTTGDFTGAAKLVEAAGEIYGGDAFQNIADYLNTDPQLLDANKGARFTPQNLVQFIQQGKIPAAQTESVTPEGAAAPPTAQTTPGPGQIYGIPRFERQAQSNVPFAPLRRGLAQLRPAMYMPGLTSGQAPLGGSGFTPEALRTANQGLSPADRAYLMDVGGVSPVEASAAIGTPVGQLQAEYNQLRPGGLFSTGAPASRGLPEDFVLQTGAYGAPIPTFFTPDPAKTTSPSESSSANANQPGSIDGGGGEVGFDQNASSFGGGSNSFGMSASELGNAIAQGVDAFGLTSVFAPSLVSEEDAAPISNAAADAAAEAAGNAAIASMADTAGFGGTGDDGVTGGDGVDYEVGGLIKMAEGGGPPKMTELSVEDLGSTFDISKYIDDEGRLVGGMSKPIRDAYGKIIGYESGDLPLPIQRDVVFGKELREKEAAMRLTDAERKQMMVEMAMRQGRTGIDPRVGGLAGIEIGDPMMRRRPQYYSTVEQFRPRYAEGGIASVAQNLADKGRKGDSMLVHMTPDEVAGLQALAQQMGGSLTVNPQTGLPEANIFKKLLPMALGFALGPAGFGVFQSALTTGLAVGAGYTLATGSLQQGLAAGLGAYGGSNLGTGLQAAGTADAATSAAASDAASSGLQVAGGAGGAAAEAAMVDPTALHPDLAGTITPSGSSVFDLSPPANYSVAAPGAAEGVSLGTKSGFQASLPEVSSVSLTSADPTATSFETGLGGGVTPTAPPATPGSAFTGLERSLLGDKATSDLAAERYAARTGSTLGTSFMQTLGGATLQSAADEQEAVKAQQAAIDEKREKRKRLAEEVARQTLGRVTVRSGGLMKLAGGGMSYMEAGGTTGPTGAPRDVVGNGDGMSDSVPADIEGVQEARLADGEFVIPADVVADIGNGSSDAGSKKLYDMMDRVRKARHGTTEQPPEIKAERLMPA
jgi:hypothetical protein